MLCVGRGQGSGEGSGRGDMARKRARKRFLTTEKVLFSHVVSLMLRPVNESAGTLWTENKEGNEVSRNVHVSVDPRVHTVTVNCVSPCLVNVAIEESGHSQPLLVHHLLHKLKPHSLHRGAAPPGTPWWKWMSLPVSRDTYIKLLDASA